MAWPFADLWPQAKTHEQFVNESLEHCALWLGVYRMAKTPAWAIERAAALGARYRLVVLSEDWCGDAVNTQPVLAKWALATSTVELRVLERDDHPKVMDRYLTGGVARSIPVVIVLTEAMDELGWWGPRPRELQAWVRAERAKGRAKAEIYPEVRRWYAKDRGESTLREVLEIMV
jgi:hypothetical protein